MIQTKLPDYYKRLPSYVEANTNDIQSFVSSWKKTAYTTYPLKSIILDLGLSIEQLTTPFPYFYRSDGYNLRLAYGLIAPLVGCTEIDPYDGLIICFKTLQKTAKEYLVQLAYSLGATKDENVLLAILDVCLTFDREEKSIDQLLDMWLKLKSDEYLSLDTYLPVPLPLKTSCRNDVLYFVATNPTSFTFILNKLVPYDTSNIKNILDAVTSNKGTRYFDLDTQKRVNKPTVDKKQLSNEKWLICSNDSHLFKLLVGLLDIVERRSNKEETKEAPTHTYNLRRIKLPNSVRMQVWRQHCGNGLDSQCFACDNPITMEAWECGHVVAVANGGTNQLDNLRPICSACNKSMSTKNMYEFMLEFGLSGISKLK